MPFEVSCRCLRSYQYAILGNLQSYKYALWGCLWSFAFICGHFSHLWLFAVIYTLHLRWFVVIRSHIYLLFEVNCSHSCWFVVICGHIIMLFEVVCGHLQSFAVVCSIKADPCLYKCYFLAKIYSN